MIHPVQRVADIAAQRPGAAEIFRAFRIDCSRDGDRPLADAAASSGVDLAMLRSALKALDTSPEVAPADTADLIAHIIAHYHAVHLVDFGEAIRLARVVEVRHAAHPRRPYGLADVLAVMADELAGHQRKEETVLFPMMLAGGDARIGLPIARLTHEHDEVAGQLRRLAAMTMDFTPPDDACPDWRTLYATCARIDATLREHMRLENDILFSRFV